MSGTIKPIPTWLDCDVGHDDAMAIVLAAYSPHIKLLGISSVSGNSTIKNTTSNAVSVLQAAGIRDVKVYKGASKALVKTSSHAEDIHGVSGIDGTDLLPKPDFDNFLAKETHAVNAMRDAIMNHPDPVSVVAVGPLTNIALLVNMYPEVVPKIKTLSIMGGAIGIGNISCAAEFNIYYDPEAAQAVLTSGIEHIALVPLEVTHTVLANKEVISRIDEAMPGSKFAQLVKELLLFFTGSYDKMFGEDIGAPLHDPVAMAYLFMRNEFTEKHVHLEVDCSDGPSRGRTHCDMYGKRALPANCWVTTAVNVPAFWNNMIDAMTHASANPSIE